MHGILIGRVRGIDLLVNWSVLVVAWLISWSLAAEALPNMAEGHSDTAYWVAAIITTAGFLAGLVAHELGHSLVALRHGVQVRSITLWLFGGVAQLSSSPPDPRSALRIAAAGPAVSVAIGVAAIIVAAAGDGGLVSTSVLWFGSMNLFLAAFNLLPAFPLDGGRIYQAWQWERTGDEQAATDKAARAGLFTGGVLVWIGVIELLFAGIIGGLWLMAIGWFLREAARQEATGSHVTLQRMTVASVMTSAPETVRDTTTVDSFVAGALLGGRHAAYPVVTETGDVVAMVSINQVGAVPRDDWEDTPVAAIATPLDRLVTVRSSDSLAVLSDRLGLLGQTRAVVLDDEGALVGVVAPSDLARLLAVLQLGVGPARRAGSAGRLRPARR